MTFKTILGACAACLTMASAASANVEYNCGQFNNATYSITYFDEEDIAEIRAVDLAGQMASALMRPAPGLCARSPGSMTVSPRFSSMASTLARPKRGRRMRRCHPRAVAQAR